MAKQIGSIPVPEGNLLDTIVHPSVVATGSGVLGGYLARKALIGSNRNLFGIASREVVAGRPTGKIVYYAPKTDAGGNVIADPTRKLPNAKTARLALAAAQLLAGTLVVGFNDDPTLDLAGIGLAAGGIANVAMALLDID